MLFIQIVDGPELWVETTDLSSTLVITEVTTQHAGRYTIVVRDRRSSAQHTLSLSVIGKPMHICICRIIFFEQLSHRRNPTRNTTTPGLLSCDLPRLRHKPCAVLVRALLWWWQCRPGLCGGDKEPRRSWFCRLEEADRSVCEYLICSVCAASSAGVLFQSECLQRGGNKPARTSFTTG